MPSIDEQLKFHREHAEKESPGAMKYLAELRRLEMAQIEGKADSNAHALALLRKGVYILLTILIVAQLGQGLWSQHINEETKNVAHSAKSVALTAKNNSVETNLLAEENHKLIEEFKMARRNSILTSCKESNEHHKNAAVLINSIIPASQKKTAKQKEQLAIFDEAIAPSYDCAARLRKFTKP